MAKAKEGDKRIGNQFWKLSSKHGRDKLFKTPELMWEAACEYFQWCIDNPLKEHDYVGGFATEVYRKKTRPFTLQGLCLYLNANSVYFNNFEYNLRDKKDDESKAFCEIVTRIRDTIYKQKFEGAAAGIFNNNIIARDLGLADKSQIDANVKTEPLFSIDPLADGIQTDDSPKKNSRAKGKD